MDIFLYVCHRILSKEYRLFVILSILCIDCRKIYESGFRILERKDVQQKDSGILDIVVSRY